jgi:hypothetical protein
MSEESERVEQERDALAIERAKLQRQSKALELRVADLDIKIAELGSRYNALRNADIRACEERLGKSVQEMRASSAEHNASVARIRAALDGDNPLDSPEDAGPKLN